MSGTTVQRPWLTIRERRLGRAGPYSAASATFLVRLAPAGLFPSDFGAGACDAAAGLRPSPMVLARFDRASA